MVDVLHAAPGDRRRAGRRLGARQHGSASPARPTRSTGRTRARSRASSSAPAIRRTGRPRSSTTASGIACTSRSSTASPTAGRGIARRIVEYVSDDLERWRVVGEIPLSSDRVIDACVARCPDGRWRLWYKDEADDSTTWVAVSDDLDVVAGRGARDRRATARGAERVRARAAGGGCSSTSGAAWACTAQPTRSRGRVRAGPDEVILGSAGPARRATRPSAGTATSSSTATAPRRSTTSRTRTGTAPSWPRRRPGGPPERDLRRAARGRAWHAAMRS